jgi:phospholipase C
MTMSRSSNSSSRTGAPLTGRSRDNLPNPRTYEGNPYVPINGPAIGDLFDMFSFGRRG